MKWPKKVKHRNKVLAKIYRPCAGRGSYRVAWSVSGKRMMKSFPTYGGKGGALEYAEGLVPDLAKGSLVTRLTPGQANDALAALERLEGFFQATGRRVSLLAVASEWSEAATKLGERAMGQAVDGFLSSVVSIKRTDLAEAVVQFIDERAKKIKPTKPGKRPALSAGYHYIVCMWLREFAKTLPKTAVCDLTKDLLNAYISQHDKVSERTRNGRRTVLGMFLRWCVCRDYLAAGHRLLEATGMKQEDYEPEEIDFYRPDELAGLLQAASNQAEYRPMLPVIALCGLAGLRLQEAVRLTYEDVFGVEGYIEISRTKSKTRARRLVTICPALARWLAPYRGYSGPIWLHGLDKFHADFGSLRMPLRIPARRNGLRHAWVTYHLAKHKNENLTAAEAGNTPVMIHGHYNGLATPEEAEKWFSVGPQLPTNVLPLAVAAEAHV